MAESYEVEPEKEQQDPDHEEEMVAKVDKINKEANPDTEESASEDSNEELLAGKYKTEDDLQQGILELLKKDQGDDLESLYKNLESQVLTDGESEKEASKTSEEESEKEASKTSEEESEEKTQDSPIDFNKYEQEFFEKGNLEEESYEELKDQGFPKHVVDNYLKGIKAEANDQAQEIFKTVDGEENYNNMVAWAEENLPEEDKQAFNQAVTSGNQAQTKFAVEGLFSRYNKDAEGDKPSRVIDKGKVPKNNSGSFQSRSEVTEAMSSEKYQNDPAFRKEIEKKLKNSNVF
jgi:hypothetical protein